MAAEAEARLILPQMAEKAVLVEAVMLAIFPAVMQGLQTQEVVGVVLQTIQGMTPAAQVVQALSFFVTPAQFNISLVAQ
jgi:hypothetical protein